MEHGGPDDTGADMGELISLLHFSDVLKHLQLSLAMTRTKMMVEWGQTWNCKQYFIFLARTLMFKNNKSG